MSEARKFLLLIPVFFSSSIMAQETDTVMYARDSAILPSMDQTVLFFQQAEKPADLSKTMVITKAGKTVSLAALIKPMWNPDLALTDLDSDGKKELLVYQYTNEKSGIFNAADDEISFYESIANKKYQYAGKLIGGHTVITEERNFVYNLRYHFGNFFIGPGGNYTDTSDAAPISLGEITLNYDKGKLVLPKGDQELRSIINDNLGKLGEHATGLPVTNDDDGTRKEIALNLAVYYYSFGKNLAATKTLFNKNFKDPDASTVWKAFVKHLQQLSMRVSF